MGKGIKKFKLVMLGYAGVGKSSITAQFSQGIFLTSYDPTIEDCWKKQLEVEGKHFMLEIIDTAGTENLSTMR